MRANCDACAEVVLEQSPDILDLGLGRASENCRNEEAIMLHAYRGDKSSKDNDYGRPKIHIAHGDLERRFE